MPSHLFALSIGPVQDFIAAARRTRDLWFGSCLLSETSKAAARAVRETGGSLIFPAPKTPDELNEGGDLNVANVILAELPDGVTPIDVAQASKDAAHAYWKKQAEKAKNEVKPSNKSSEAGSLINDEIWDEQVGDVIECFAAWTPLYSTDTYGRDRQRVMRLLAGRKACRDFFPAKGRHGVPKSSLDGMRESVWTDPKTVGHLNKRLDRRLRLSDGEQLDVVGLTKRLGGGRKGYPSVSRIAADPWLRGVASSPDTGGHFSRLKELSETLVGKGVTRVDWPQYRHFPYEGTVVYRHRHKELARETGQDQSEYGELTTLIETLEGRFGAPTPYCSILVADGDRMGKIISMIDSPGAHRQFSQQLAAFAVRARNIVEDKRHNGSVVYSGGDDVLALVPTDRCLDCARALHDEFGKIVVSGVGDGRFTPTLSVGIAIGHFLEPLQDLLEYGRAAEKVAKQPHRDGLAIHLHTRGGVPIEVQAPWSTNLDRRMQSWAKMHLLDQLPDKAAYDLRQLSREYAGWPEKDNALAEAIRSDAKRLIARKMDGNKATGLTEVYSLLDTAQSSDNVYHLAKEIIVAKHIATAQSQAAGHQEGQHGQSKTIHEAMK